MAVGALAAVAAATAAAAGSLEFRVNVTSQLSPAPHYWEACVGSGHAALGLRSDWRDHLALCRERLGFRRIRQHGVLDDDMGPVVVKQGASGALAFNFTAVDSVYDYLLSIGVSPLVELSWMPAVIAKNPRDKVWCYKGGHSPPSDPAQWHDTVAALGRHVVDRYGVDIVRSWSFEVWNEPNCPPCVKSAEVEAPDELFPPCVPGVSVRNKAYPACAHSDANGGWDLATYLAVYNASSSALKAVDAGIQVGGPSSEQLGWIDQLRDYCAEHGVGLDFISTHQYPTDTQVPPDVEGHSDTIREAVEAASPRPLFITEYSVGGHDDPSAAAGILTYIPRLQGPGGPAVYSYWAFSDVFEEHCLDSTPYHNGWGLVNWYGIPKPSFRAFEMLHAAGDASAPVEVFEEGAWRSPTPYAAVATGANDTSSVTVWVAVGEPVAAGGAGGAQEKGGSASGSSSSGGSSGNSGSSGGDGSAARLATVFVAGFATPSARVDANETATVVLHVCGAASLPPTARLRRIDAGHANPKQLWVNAGSPKQANATLLAALQRASELVDEAVALTPAPGGACAAATVDLPLAAGVAVIDFNYTAAA